MQYGRELKKSEIREITFIIKKEIDVEISFDSAEELGLHGIRKPYEKDVTISEALFYQGSVRSGQRVEYEGSIIILGDVNGGGEIIAGDNIVVLGTLRGLAHAGAKGNKKAIISAHLMDTMQLRIAHIVKEIERSDETIVKMAYASIEEEEIVIK